MLLNAGLELIRFKLTVNCWSFFSIYLKGFYVFFPPRQGLHARVSDCLVSSFEGFSLMYEFAFTSSTLSQYRLHLFRWFYDVNSAKTHQIGYLLSPNILSLLPKTDDSKYNYIHFLLLFSPFSLHISCHFSGIGWTATMIEYVEGGLEKSSWWHIRHTNG